MATGDDDVGWGVRRQPSMRSPASDDERDVARRVRRVDQSIADAIEEGISVERPARAVALPVPAIEKRAERHRRRQWLRDAQDESL